MNERGSGYVDEIAYTFGYCDELNPVQTRLALLHAGVAPPNITTACELGFGHGVSANIHAAGSATEWFGTDFNPDHAQFAQGLASASGAKATFADESFDVFCHRTDLPDFDFIGLHGTWSWISDTNRALLLHFISRKLKPGGVVYMGYNAQPGWTAMLPVRELMIRHFDASANEAAANGATGQEHIRQRIHAAVHYAQAAFASQPGYALLNPMLTERVVALSGENAGYLAHEYFNRDWHPMFFSQVASAFDAVGLSFAAWADYRDAIDEINLTPSQRSLLKNTSDPVLKETLRDLCVNRSFRRDYWIKEPRRLDASERLKALAEHRVILALPRASVALRVRGALGETALDSSAYAPILDALADHRPATLEQIQGRMGAARITMPRIAEAAMLLIAMGVLLNAQDEATIAAARPAAARLNAAICERTLHAPEVLFLASPVSGSGVSIPRIAQLFLLARARGMESPAQWAEFARQVIPDSELEAKARRFEAEHIPVLIALGIA